MLPSAERGRSGGGRCGRKAPTRAAWAITPHDHRPLPSSEVPTHEPSPVFMRWISAMRIEQTRAGEIGGGVEARPVAIGAAFTIAGERGVDQLRVHLLHVVVGESEL